MSDISEVCYIRVRYIGVLLYLQMTNDFMTVANDVVGMTSWRLWRHGRRKWTYLWRCLCRVWWVSSSPVNLENSRPAVRLYWWPSRPGGHVWVGGSVGLSGRRRGRHGRMGVASWADRRCGGRWKMDYRRKGWWSWSKLSGRHGPPANIRLLVSQVIFDKCRCVDIVRITDSTWILNHRYMSKELEMCA